MTESEARSKIKYRIEVAREIAGNGVDGKAFEDLEIAIQALKEIREYRAIGTVEEITNLIKFLSFDDDTSILEDLRMLVEYYAIGTVEEFKALKEKKVIPVANIKIGKEDMQEIVNEKVKEFELDAKEIRNKAIDEFAERIKQGDVIEYMGSYVSYEAIASFIDEIAEQLKGGATDES